MTNLNVLLWSPKGSGMHYGGPGMSAYRLYSARNADAVSVSLAHGYAPQERYDLFDSQHFIHSISGSDPYSAHVFLRKAGAWLKENVRDYDVFHGLQGFHATVQPATRAESYGVPAVVKLAAYRTELVNKSILNALLRLPQKRRAMLRQLSAVIAISRAIEGELLGYGVPQERIAYIPNGVDIAVFAPEPDVDARSLNRSRLGLEDLPTVLFVGALTERKRPHLLIEAVHLAKQRGREYQLLLVGPFDEQSAYVQGMRQRVEALGLSELVRFTGFTTDTPSFYGAADVFALPSANEGLPNALLEAMASGLPAVLTPFEGVADLADGSYSLTVAPEAAELEQALAHYLDHPTASLAAGLAARSRAEKDFSTEAVMRQHLQLFRRIRAGKDAAT